MAVLYMCVAAMMYRAGRKDHIMLKYVVYLNEDYMAIICSWPRCTYIRNRSKLQLLSLTWIYFMHVISFLSFPTELKFTGKCCALVAISSDLNRVKYRRGTPRVGVWCSVLVYRFIIDMVAERAGDVRPKTKS